MAGRKPIPTILKKLKGTAQPCRTNDAEPRPEALDAKPPAHLDAEAKKYWLETYQLLSDVKVLSVMDRDVLTLYAMTKAKWIEATKQLKKNGMTIVAQSGFPVQNPWLAIANKAFDQLLKLQCEMGMTPSSRQKVSADLSDKVDPMEAVRARLKAKREYQDHERANAKH